MSVKRLDKIIAVIGNITRSESKKLIQSGKVYVNGISVREPEYKLDPQQAVVSIENNSSKYEEHVYIMLNKPKGFVSATSDSKDKTVLDLLDEKFRKRNLFPAGRLDKDTTGFVLITDDGAYAHRILAPKSHVRKVYEAVLSDKIDDAGVAAIEQGILLKDGSICRPAEVKVISQDGKTIEITLVEGMYHQIKRMVAAAGSSVVDLHRKSIGGILLDDSLEPGEYRMLTNEEISSIASDSDMNRNPVF